MMVTGTNGQGSPVLGIVDSGADSTCFPYGYASLMGYDPSTLNPQTTGHAAGTALTYLGTMPASMVLPELPSLTVEFYPRFCEGLQFALWGRADFMAQFEVTFVQAEQRFLLTANAH